MSYLVFSGGNIDSRLNKFFLRKYQSVQSSNPEPSGRKPLTNRVRFSFRCSSGRPDLIVCRSVRSRVSARQDLRRLCDSSLNLNAGRPSPVPERGACELRQLRVAVYIQRGCVI